MSNVIIISGGLSNAIVAGGVGSNGPAFPINKFLLAYDPSIDPTIHSTGITSSLPFSATATSGDSSLIERGGHLIFSTVDYTLSNEEFLILSGSEVFTAGGTTVTNSDKSAKTVITLEGGKPLLTSISAASLYTTALGSWTKSAGADSIAGYTGSNSLTADRDNFFTVESYSPIMASGTTLRGLFKCRVGSGYGEFKFNKIGLYLATSGTVTPPVLVAVACLNTPITKTKTGTSITNLEFDIEIEFHTEGAFADVVYMTGDYWTKVPTTSGYGLFTDTDVAIGSSGIGWEAKAKLDVSSENNERPILCLNNRFNKQYMFFDVTNYLDGSYLSGASQLKLYTDSNSDDYSTNARYYSMFNRYAGYVGEDGGGTIDNLGTTWGIHKHGFYTERNYCGQYFNEESVSRVHGLSSRLTGINNVDTVIGVYGYIENYGSVSTKTFGGYFEVNGVATAINCDKYGVYGLARGKGKNLYGGYFEAEPHTGNTNYSYGVYSKANGVITPELCTFYGEVSGGIESQGCHVVAMGNANTVTCYGVMGRALGTTYAAQLASVGASMYASGQHANTAVYGIYSYATAIVASKNLFGIWAEVAGTSLSGSYAGYFKAPNYTNSYALYADGNTRLSGTLVVGSATTLATTLSVSGNLSVKGFSFFGELATGLKCAVYDILLMPILSATTLSATDISYDSIVNASCIVFSETSSHIILPSYGEINGVSNNYYYTFTMNDTGVAQIEITCGHYSDNIRGATAKVIIWYKE